MPVNVKNSVKYPAKIIIWLGAIILVGTLLVLAVLLNPAYALPSESKAFVQNAVKKQQDTEAAIHSAYQAGQYNFASPLVLQDPYGMAPLTALVLFDTPENTQVAIHVPGKTPEASVDFTFAGYQQHHEIPIYGLYADSANLVTISIKPQNGQSTQKEIALQTEPLPVYSQEVKVEQVVRAKYSPGLNFTFLDHKMVFDIDGAVRWYSTQTTFQVFSRLNNGRFLYSYQFTDKKNTVLMEQDLLGKIYAVYNIADGVQHDITELPGGNLLLTSEDSKSSTTQDFIIEVSRKTGHIVRSFDLKNILDQYRPKEIGLVNNDWLHLNSIVYNPADSSIIISSKAQSAVVKLSYPGMKIQWILGPHDNWSAQYQPYLLTPVGKGFEWQWSQHDATLLSLASPASDTLDILLFDNGLNRSFDPAAQHSPVESYSRVVHYRINQKLKTVEQVWEYGKERGSAIFSYYLGGAGQEANGNILGNWGAITRDAQGNPLTYQDSSGSVETKLIEVDPNDSAVVFECTIPGTLDYRTFRAGLYDGYSEGSNYLSIRVLDTSRSDLVDRGVMLWRDIQHSWDALILSLKRFARRIL
jgi:arylsulfate sulfotransferase